MNIVLTSLLMNELKFRFQIPLINISQFASASKKKRHRLCMNCGPFIFCFVDIL